MVRDKASGLGIHLLATDDIEVYCKILYKQYTQYCSKPVLPRVWSGLRAAKEPIFRLQNTNGSLNFLSIQIQCDNFCACLCRELLLDSVCAAEIFLQWRTNLAWRWQHLVHLQHRDDKNGGAECIVCHVFYIVTLSHCEPSFLQTAIEVTIKLFHARNRNYFLTELWFWLKCFLWYHRR
jgi:hypothetical protein